MAKKDMEIEMEAMPVDNVGIMQGFLEMMNEDDDLEEGDDEMEAGEMLGRTPDSPEILMNNLRGDMRSIDARRDELADMVGYAAAVETPDSVLAMLQPVLAQQGIGAMVPPGMGLPPGAGMPPGPSPVSPVGAPNMPNVPNMPSDMMAPMQPMPAGGIGDMAPGAMPPGPPPLQMARGGVVQRFSNGTSAPNEEQDGGVSAIGNPSAADDSAAIDMDTLIKLYNASARTMPSLKDVYTEKQRTYSDVLGGNRGDLSKLGLLTSLAERGFAYAANVDPITGQPMRGSQLSRLAGVARGLPTEMMKTAAAQKAEDRGIKLAALNAAEATLTARQKAEYDIAKEKAKKAGNYGLGTSWQANRMTLLNTLLPKYEAGELPDDQKNMFEMLADTMKSTSTYTDEKGDVITRITGVPERLKEALEKGRGKEKVSGGAPGVGAVGEVGAVKPASTAQGALPTMVSMVGKATGPINVTAAALERYSAGLFDDIKPGAIQSDAFTSLAANRLNRAFAESPRFAEGERQQIQRELDMLPGLLKSEGAFVNRAIGLDTLLERLEMNAFSASRDGNLAVPDRNTAARDFRIIQDARSLIGATDLPFIQTADDIRTVFPTLKVGDMYKLRDPKSGAIVAKRKTKEGKF